MPSESDGASAVEFALVFPLAFFLIAASFELGMLMFNQAAIESAVREAARYGMTGQGTETERAAAILAIVDKYTYGLVDPRGHHDHDRSLSDISQMSTSPSRTWMRTAMGNGIAGETYTEVNGSRRTSG